jgi:hypothetical protein
MRRIEEDLRLEISFFRDGTDPSPRLRCAVDD